MPFLADCWQDLKKGQALGLALDSGVTLVEADVLKPEQLAAALVGVQAVICATGYTGFNPGGRVQGEEGEQSVEGVAGRQAKGDKVHTRQRQGRGGVHLQPSQLITHRLSKLRPSYAACSRRHTVLAKRWWGLQKAGNLTSACAAAVAVALRFRPGG